MSALLASTRKPK